MGSSVIVGRVCGVALPSIGAVCVVLPGAIHSRINNGRGLCSMDPVAANSVHCIRLCYSSSCGGGVGRGLAAARMHSGKSRVVGGLDAPNVRRHFGISVLVESR